MKRVLSVICSILILVMCMVPSEQIYANSLTISGVPSNVKIGDEFKLNITCPKGISAKIIVEYDSKVISYVSGDNASGGNGLVIVTGGSWGEDIVKTNTITFKAIGAGSTSIKVSTNDATDIEGNSILLNGTSTTVTVDNQATDNPTEPQKSADNSLSSLKLSNATLSPSFKKSTTKYTATVAYDITKVVVSAKTSNNKAVIESVTDNGTVNLKVGENTIKIVVRAENGVKATYTIVVTRKAQESTPVTPPEVDTPPTSEITPPEVNEMLQWNGEQLYPVETILTESIPANFESTLLVVNGQQMQGLSFTKGDLKLLYLNNTNGAGSLYVFDETQQTIYPFIKLISEKGYVLVLLPDEQNAPAPAGFKGCTFSIEGKGLVSAYQLNEDAANEESEVKIRDFYLMYCMNDAGEKGWYMYDSVEGTYQRYFTLTPSVQTDGNVAEGDISDKDLESKYATLEKELNIAKMTQYIILAIAAVIILILIIVIIVLAVTRRKKAEDSLEVDKVDQDVEAAEQEIHEAEMTKEILAIEEALSIEETIEIEENDDEIEIEFFEMEEPIEEPEEVVEEEESDEIEIEFYEMESLVENQEEIEDKDKTEVQDLENAIINAIENAKKEVDPVEEPEIKIVRKPRTVDLTSKFSSKKEEDDDDLEFIDFD